MPTYAAEPLEFRVPSPLLRVERAASVAWGCRPGRKHVGLGSPAPVVSVPALYVCVCLSVRLGNKRNKYQSMFHCLSLPRIHIFIFPAILNPLSNL